MKRFIAVALACLLACSAAMAADPDTEELDAQITQFLMTMNFGKLMKDAVVASLKDDKRGGATARALMQLPEQRYAAVAAPLFRSEVSLEGARKMVQFYTSETMNRVRAAQDRNGDKDTPVGVTPAEYAEYEAFMKSEPGRAAFRIGEAISQSAFQDKYLAALEEEMDRLFEVSEKETKH